MGFRLRIGGMTSFRRLFLLSLYLGFFVILFFVAGVFLCDQHITKKSAPKIHTEINDVAAHKVALILGCSPTVADGRENLYFLHRINAAAEAYHAGKCQYLIVSGDNSRKTYNEPEAMKLALIVKGIPEEYIIEDFAGFRTLDSVVRAREIFGQSDLLVISQPFHNERAIYIGQQHGMELTGFNAPDVGAYGGWKTRVREKLARVKTLIDLHVTQQKPKFLGDPIAIGIAANR